MKMQKVYPTIFILIILFIPSFSYAVQFELEDISNKVISCDTPLLANFPDGTCLIAPDNTFQATVVLEENETEEVLENLHVVILNKKGEFYEYNPRGGELWKKVPRENLDGNILLTSSFPKLPFETHSISRQIHLDNFELKDNIELFLSVRPNQSSGFKQAHVKKVKEFKKAN